jgi:hypothetical protein
VSPAGEASGTGLPDGDLPLDARQRLHRRALFALPVIAVVPVVIAVVLAGTLAPARAGAAALGAAGWLVTVALRAPAGALVSSRMPKQAASTLTFPALLSGPAEELIRLLLVLFGVKGFGSLLWAGFGWGTIEVVSTLVTALGVRRLLLIPARRPPGPSAAGSPGVAAPRPPAAASADRRSWLPYLVPAARASPAAGRTCGRAVAWSGADHRGRWLPRRTRSSALTTDFLASTPSQLAATGRRTQAAAAPQEA